MITNTPPMCHQAEMLVSLDTRWLEKMLISACASRISANSRNTW